jgi:hypothetical protein
MRRPPIYRVLLAAVLLVAIQQAAQWHALDHLGAWFQRAHEQALHVPTPDGPCAICALFAGGASAAPSETTSFPPSEVGFVASTSTDLLVATAAPSSYQIRAPPALL